MNFFVWINEEDHMRIISMEKGDDIKAIFVRFANSTAEIQKVLKNNGYDFMHNDHLGFILTCPSNLGTGLRAGAMVKLPTSPEERTSRKSAPSSPSRLVVAPVLTLLPSAALGISPTPTVLVSLRPPS